MTLKKPTKEDVKWLREQRFYKLRNQLEWHMNVSADPGQPSPDFSITLILAPGIGWHACVYARRPTSASSELFIYRATDCDLYGIPDDWQEGFHVPLGYAVCASSPRQAVAKAVRRARALADGIVSRDWYDIHDLEDELGAPG